MQILAVASNGAVVRQGRKVELRPLESFMTAGQRSRIQANQEYEQAVLTKIRSALESKMN